MVDVAKLAGVSQATVSHVINESAPISEEVTERVQKVIKELNYVPNALAKWLKQNKTNTIGLLIPDIDSGYYAEIVKEVESTLRERGFITFLCNTFYDSNLEKLYIKALIQQSVEGILICYGLVNKNVYKEIYNLGINLVVLDDKEVVKGVQVPSVEVNNINGSLLAIKHIYNIGAKKICFASEPLFNRALKLRYEGFKKAIQEYGYKDSDVTLYIENNQYNKIEMGYNIGSQILLDSNTDAVFASSDNLAFGIIKRFREHGVNIPDDIAIIGYDDIPLCKIITPTLTTISQPKKLIAKKGVEMLLDVINGESSNLYFMIEPSLIIRESTMKRA
ncbi:MAG: hypothetical protein A2Z35_05665 [Actinobacteria bacterium RBG_19FT_COMBO_36_27]|nr:MAG: hypothetical protein A2Z35_05665 [Actinobacteria bacterium RBG_19FT_COMBO_36_27]